jgi:hypothetical protein
VYLAAFVYLPGLLAKATLVSPGDDADEGAVVDEGATSVALARVHQVVFWGASANLIGQQISIVESRALVFVGFSPF